MESKLMKDKRGGVLLRDMLIIMTVGVVIVLMAGILVEDVANSYDNTNMSDEWFGSGTSNWGATTSGNLSSDLDELMNVTQSPDDGVLGAFTTINIAYTGVSTVFKVIFLSPVYIGGIIAEGARLAGASDLIANYIQFIISLALYSVIIFGIITALLRGSKV